MLEKVPNVMEIGCFRSPNTAINRKLSTKQCQIDKFLLTFDLKREKTNSEGAHGADMHAYAQGERVK